ncbi:MAG: hypothetical protein HY898_01230 [Deltaproteobacteria bacterium]|nr:hypothetical protein [Deltaproteobacteria bacterium]
MKTILRVGCALALLGILTGCGSLQSANPTPRPPVPNNLPPPKPVVDAFQAALARLVELDRTAGWSEATCAQVAGQFLAAEQRSPGGKLAAARYNAGLAWQRCSHDAKAREQFRSALEADPSLSRAGVQLALYDLKEKGDAALDSTIERLQDAVLAAKFQDVDALINLAMLEMRRGANKAWQGCSDDGDCSKINIRRALAIDDAYMPAFNQLALYYLALARSKSGQQGQGLVAGSARKARLSGQMLDLAALVCSQAIRKNPRYAPIHNTAGLVQVELGNINSAVQEFNLAREIDPGFFEAQMNYAAVNLSFRGYGQSENAYRQALSIRPSSYEAHLGLALALRGQITDSNWDSKLKETQAELDRCKTLSGDRPEAWYNEAILTQEYKSKIASGDLKEAIAVLKQASATFDAFIKKAGAAAQYSEAVKRSSDRKKDIDDTITFMEQALKGGNPQPAPDTAPPPPPSSPAGLEEGS